MNSQQLAFNHIKLKRKSSRFKRNDQNTDLSQDEIPSHGVHLNILKLKDENLDFTFY